MSYKYVSLASSRCSENQPRSLIGGIPSRHLQSSHSLASVLTCNTLHFRFAKSRLQWHEATLSVKFDARSSALWLRAPRLSVQRLSRFERPQDTSCLALNSLFHQWHITSSELLHKTSAPAVKNHHDTTLLGTLSALCCMRGRTTDITVAPGTCSADY